MSPGSPDWALPFGQGNSPGCWRLRPRGRTGRARRWRDPDAAPRLRQPRWRELRAPLELGSRRLEGPRPALGRPWAPPSCAPQPGALALPRPLYRLPPSPGPERLMEAPSTARSVSGSTRCGPRGSGVRDRRRPGRAGPTGHLHEGSSLLFLVYTYVFGGSHGAETISQTPRKDGSDAGFVSPWRFLVGLQLTVLVWIKVDETYLLSGNR